MTRTFRPRKTIFETNYAALVAVIGEPAAWPKAGEVARFKAAGYMDLVVERVLSPAGELHLSLAHYGVQNGDMMRDPEMVVRVYPDRKMVEALSIQMDYIGLYKVVYPGPRLVHPRQKTEQNAFLRTWMRNLKAQGHKLAAETADKIAA